MDTKTPLLDMLMVALRDARAAFKAPDRITCNHDFFDRVLREQDPIPRLRCTEVGYYFIGVPITEDVRQQSLFIIHVDARRGDQ